MIGDPVVPHVIVQAETDGGAKLIYGPFDGEQTAKDCLPDVRAVADDVGYYTWSVVPLVSVVITEPEGEQHTMHVFVCTNHSMTHEIEVTQTDLNSMVNILTKATPHGDPRCPSDVLSEVRA